MPLIYSKSLSFVTSLDLFFSGLLPGFAFDRLFSRAFLLLRLCGRFLGALFLTHLTFSGWLFFDFALAVGFQDDFSLGHVLIIP